MDPIIIPVPVTLIPVLVAVTVGTLIKLVISFIRGK